MEAAVKLARQYFLEKSPPEPQRTHFIARHQSYHGNTLGALSIGGHASRREHFKPLLMKDVSHVSSCYPYRRQGTGETDDQYVARLVKELDDEFQRVGPETVCAFVAEPVVGAVRTRLNPDSEGKALISMQGHRMRSCASRILQSSKGSLRQVRCPSNI